MNSPISRIDHVVRPSGRVFHGWWLVLGAAGIQLLSGALMMHSFGAYTVALQAQFGWSKTALSGAFALTRAESGLLGPLQGWLVDRFGPRPVLRWGLTIFAVGFALFALTDSLLVFYIAWALIALGSSLGGFATLTVAIVNWFDQHRAKAVAVSQLGFSFGGMGVTLVILSIELVGWRWTAAGSAIVVLLVGLPLVNLVHHRPENVGEIPDGTDEPHPVVARRRPRDRDLTPTEAMRTRAFWYISSAHALALLTVSAVTAHLIPHVTEGLGFTPIQAGFAVMLMTATQITGQLLGGWLGDHFDKRLLCVGCMLGHGSGFALLAFATDWAMVIGFAVLNGLAWGVRGPLMVALRADYFGATSFGTIMGFSSLIAMFGMAFGALFAGAMADIFGDYVLGFAVLAAGSGLGAILFALCERPTR
ncbi:MAG: MFS transporter [Gammaproteobacteria bacterium]|nr:MFS transporter [Gammaproteobacteria bacterium]